MVGIFSSTSVGEACSLSMGCNVDEVVLPTVELEEVDLAMVIPLSKGIREIVAAEAVSCSSKAEKKFTPLLQVGISCSNATTVLTLRSASKEKNLSIR